jgi:tripartite-type tricarboxylate transporter receptor subunit TctC
MRNVLKFILRSLVLASILVFAGSTLVAAADDYPTRPITFVVPSGVGGDADRMARALANYMSKEINAPIVVENHVGGANLVGHKYFLQQPADGYTILITSAHPYIPINILQMNAGFKLEDFDYVDILWQDYAGLYANKDRPWKDLPSLINAIKAAPGTISASTVYGASPHIGMLAIEDALGLPKDAVKIVTFDGGGETKAAVAGGTVDLTLNQLNGMETVKDRVVPLGVFTEKRAPGYDIPTINEGLKSFNVKVPDIRGSMRTFVLHPALKQKYPERYAFIVDALKRTLQRDDLKTYFKEQAMGADWIGPEESTRLMKENYAVWEKYVYLFKK